MPTLDATSIIAKIDASAEVAATMYAEQVLATAQQWDYVGSGSGTVSYDGCFLSADGATFFASSDSITYFAQV